MEKSEERWTSARKGLVKMAEMYPGIGPEEITEVLCRLVENIKAGQVGADLADEIREGFRSMARVGWNERNEDEHTILAGLQSGLDHYHDGAIMLEELAITEMMTATENGDVERAEAIQAALWEWELSLNEFGEPVAQTVYEPINAQGPALNESIRRAYYNTVPANQMDAWMQLAVDDTVSKAIAANSTSVGYDDEELPDLLQLALSAADLDEKYERRQIYRSPDVDEDLIERAKGALARNCIRGIEEGGLLSEWSRMLAIFSPLDDGEKARVLSWFVGVMERRNPIMGQFIKRTMIEALDIDVFNDDVDFYLFEERSEELPPVVEMEAKDEDIKALYRIISLPPEHPKWHPKHDYEWLIGSGLLTTRQPGKVSYASGWAAYKADHLARYRREASARHKAGRFHIVGVVESGLVADGGRRLKWSAVTGMNGQASKAMTWGDGVYDEVTSKLRGVVDRSPLAREVLEVLQ